MIFQMAFHAEGSVTVIDETPIAKMALSRDRERAIPNPDLLPEKK